MDKSKCLICDHDIYNVKFTIKGFNICQCNNCDFVFVNPLPSVEEYTEFYQSTDYEDIVFNSSIEILNQGRILDYIDYPFKQIIKSVKLNGKILDIGCGIGLMMKNLEELGYQTEGIEISEKSRNHGVKEFKLKIHDQKIEELNLAPNSFDAVLMLDIIEHIPNMSEIMRIVFNILNDEGILIIRTPNIKSFTYYVNREKWYLFIPPEHIYYFTQKHLSTFLKRFNFSIIKCHFDQALSEVLPSSSRAKMRNLYISNYPVKQNNMKSAFMKLIRKFLKNVFSISRMGDAIFMVARKQTQVQL